MSQIVNNVTFNFNSQPGGTTAGGTEWSVTFIAQAVTAPGSTDFTDESPWTLVDAVVTALASVGWTITENDISVQRAEFNDTFSNGVAATKTFL